MVLHLRFITPSFHIPSNDCVLSTTAVSVGNSAIYQLFGQPNTLHAAQTMRLLDVVTLSPCEWGFLCVSTGCLCGALASRRVRSLIHWRRRIRRLGLLQVWGNQLAVNWGFDRQFCNKQSGFISHYVVELSSCLFHEQFFFCKKLVISSTCTIEFNH